MTLRLCQLKTYLRAHDFDVATSDGCKNTLTLTFPNKRGLIGSFLLALHELPDAPDLVSCTTTRPLLQFLYIFDLKVDESRLAEVQRLVSLINKSAPLPGLSIDLMTCEVYWRYGLVCFDKLSESDVLLTLEHLGQQVMAYGGMLEAVLEEEMDVDCLIEHARATIEG